jgi:hypothetical protein
MGVRIGAGGTAARAAAVGGEGRARAGGASADEAGAPRDPESAREGAAGGWRVGGRATGAGAGLRAAANNKSDECSRSLHTYQAPVPLAPEVSSATMIYSR